MHSSTAIHRSSLYATRYSTYRHTGARGPRSGLPRTPAYAPRRGAVRGRPFPGFAHRPQDYAQRLEVVGSAAFDAGRDPMAIRPAIWLNVVSGRTREDVVEALECEVIKANGLNASDEVFVRHGSQHPLGAGFSGGHDLLAQPLDEATALSHMKAIPPSPVREILLNGTPNEVVEQLAEWQDKAVRYGVQVSLSLDRRSLRRGLVAVRSLPPQANSS